MGAQVPRGLPMDPRLVLRTDTPGIDCYAQCTHELSPRGSVSLTDEGGQVE